MTIALRNQVAGIGASFAYDASGNIIGFAGSDGSTIVYPRVLAQSAIPFILAGGTAGGGLNQFTAGAAGAISTLPTLPTTYSGGAFLYLPAGTYAGQASAGWYWFVGSSTTAGTVYNNRYTSGDPRLAVPTSPTAFGAGVGLVTQTTASALTAHQITIPGGSLGPNGRVRTQNHLVYTAVSTQNLWTSFFGAAQVMGQGMSVNSPNVGLQAAIVSVMNTNSQAAQYFHNYAGDTVNSSNLSPGYSAVNTANNVTFSTQLQLGNAQAFVIYQGLILEVMYGA